jgi:hypothetical protein
MMICGIAACSNGLSISTTSRTEGSQARRLDQTCYTEQTNYLKRGGGTLNYPGLSGTFQGKFGYSNDSLRSRFANVEVGLSNYNCWAAPVPSGYSGDWFGYIYVDTGGGKITFLNGGNKIATMQSTTLLTTTQYYFYLYDTNGNILYSTSAGTASKKGEIKFISPFQEGFATPGVALPEIVHQTPSHQSMTK